MIVTCETCLKPFTARSRGKDGYSKFCSRECSYGPGRVTVLCETCNAPFTRPAKIKSSLAQRYCSDSCKPDMSRPRLNCLQCDTVFVANIKNGVRSKFCSMDCKTKHSRVDCVCETCGETFSRRRSHPTTKKFCSYTCAMATRLVEKRDISCENCKRVFRTKQDHGVWPRFCSRKCFCAKALTPEYRQCEFCLQTFLASKSSHTGDYRRFCSQYCAGQGLRSGHMVHCAACDKPFYRSACRNDRCCSLPCRTAFYVEDRNHLWKGGEWVSQVTDIKWKRFHMKGRVSKYTPNHRIVASEYIGRPLKIGEYVIRLNRNPQDDRPENLFICESASEYSRRRVGSLPWPTKSNLESFKETADKRG